VKAPFRNTRAAGRDTRFRLTYQFTGLRMPEREVYPTFCCSEVWVWAALVHGPDRVCLEAERAGHGSVDEVCGKMGIREETFYFWKKKYSGTAPSEVRRLRGSPRRSENKVVRVARGERICATRYCEYLAISISSR